MTEPETTEPTEPREPDVTETNPTQTNPTQTGETDVREPVPVAEHRRTPDVLTMLVGLISLAAAAMALTGWAPGLPAFDPRWVLAAGAVVVGLLLLAGTLRSPGQRR